MRTPILIFFAALFIALPSHADFNQSCAQFLNTFIRHLTSQDYDPQWLYESFSKPELQAFIDDLAAGKQPRTGYLSVVSDMIKRNETLHHFNSYITPIEIYPNGLIRAVRMREKGKKPDESTSEQVVLAPYVMSDDYQRRPGTIFSWHNPVGPISHLKSQWGDEIMMMTYIAGPEDLLISWDDEPLIQKYLPSLENELSNLESHEELYSRLVQSIRSLIQEVGVNGENFYGVSLGKQISCRGGACRQGASLAYLFLNGVREISAYFEISEPEKWSPPEKFDSHMYLRTKDDFIVDPGAGVAFRIERDSDGKIVMPQNTKEKFYAKFPEDKARGDEIINEFTLHYRRSDIPFEKRKYFSGAYPPHFAFKDSWSRLLFMTEAEARKSANTGDPLSKKVVFFKSLLEKFHEVPK